MVVKVFGNFLKFHVEIVLKIHIWTTKLLILLSKLYVCPASYSINILLPAKMHILY